MKHFTTRDAARILETTESQVRFYARAGLVEPHRGPDGRSSFDFQDLLLLRTTKGLLDSGVPARHMRRLWASLRRQLAPGMPLTSITIYADGDRAVAWDGRARWRPDSGQFLLEFDASEVARRALLNTVPEEAAAVGPSSPPLGPASCGTSLTFGDRSAIPGSRDPSSRGEEGPTAAASAPSGVRRRSSSPPVLPKRSCAVSESVAESGLTAEQWFRLGCELEGTSPRESVQAYHEALVLDPDFGDAHLNLGRHYHEVRDLPKAEEHYREAIRCAPSDATCHFNLGVLLEDRERRADALAAYERAIARDADLADAHYNLGLLCETLGRRAQAMRHLMIARRLYAAAGVED